MAVSNGELVLTVPAGSNHDAAVPALDAVQVIQPISNTNFDVAVKIDSTLVAATKYYGQGLMVEGDAKDYIRFEVERWGYGQSECGHHHRRRAEWRSCRSRRFPRTRCRPICA